MAPSTYYAVKARTPSARAQRDAAMGPVLRELWEDNYRGLRHAQALEDRAPRRSRRWPRSGRRLMRAAAIEGVRRGKRVRTTKADPGALRHPDLVKRNFSAT